MIENNKKIEPEMLYNTSEVAEFLKTGRKYVYNLIHTDKIGYFKFDGEIYRISGQQMLDYLKNCEKKEKISERWSYDTYYPE